MGNEEQILQHLSQISEKLQKLEAQNLQKKQIFNFVEGCQYIGLSESYIYKLTSTNRIPFFRPTGKLIYFKREDLDAWLLRNRQSSVEEIQQLASQVTLKGGTIRNIL